MTVRAFSQSPEVAFGTVTSVALSLPGIFSVTGSPVTTSGTLTGSLVPQLPNLVFASSSSGATAVPAFRALVTADLPAGIGSGTVAAGTANQLAYYATSTNAVAGNANFTTSNGTLVTGVFSSAQGALAFSGATSGTLVIKGPAAAGANVLTFPAGTTDFSGTGGTGQFVKQTTSGGALTVAAITQANLPFIPRSYLAGCTMSTAGGSATMSIAAGSASDTTNVSMMALAAIAKTTSGWAVGTAQGGLDTGSIANSTWYHFFVIQRVDTGVVDVVFSATATPAAGPTTLPTNYTLYRRIGSGKTDGSAQWTAFIQDGNTFEWVAVVADISAANPGSSAVTRTLTVPPDVSVFALLSANINVGVTAAYENLYLSDLALTDAAASTSNCQQYSFGTAAGGNTASPITVRTSTAKQIRSRLSDGTATTLKINTYGWIDSRGVNS